MLDPTMIGPVLPCLKRGTKRYGLRMGSDRRNVGLHRATWMDHFGPIPPETPIVMHRCDEQDCYEITHLRLGTQADNMADMVDKGRHRNQQKTHCPRGHAYDAVDGKGHRLCRTCRREAARERWRNRQL